MKKSISMLLCMLMVFSLFAGFIPAGVEPTASAEGGDVTTEIRYQKVTDIGEFTNKDNLYRNYLLVCEHGGKQYALSASGMQMALGTAARTGGDNAMVAKAVSIAVSETIGDTVYYNTAEAATRDTLWGITATGTTGEASYVRTRDESFAAAPCLYINGSSKAVLTDAADEGYFRSMRFESDGSGGFCIRNGGSYIGFNGSAFYVSASACSFVAYKQVEAQFSSDGIVGTNLTNTATLNADGTYSVDMSVYTTGAKTYSDAQQVDRHANTDYVIVFDNSANMGNTDCSGWVIAGSSWAGESANGKFYKDINGRYWPVKTSHDSRLTGYSADSKSGAPKSFVDNETGKGNYQPVSGYFHQDTDGKYYPVYYEMCKPGAVRYYRFYYLKDGQYIFFYTKHEGDGVHASGYNDGTWTRGDGYVTLNYNVKEIWTDYNFKMYYTDKTGDHYLGSSGANANAVLYNGVLYDDKTGGGATRMESMKTAAYEFVDTLSTYAQENDMTVRVSLVSFDNIYKARNKDPDTGMTGAYVYNSNNANGYVFQQVVNQSAELSDNMNNFSKSFFNVSDANQKAALQNAIVQMSKGVNNDDTRSAIHYGAAMAKYALESTGKDYKDETSGDNAVVIFMTGCTTKIKNAGLAVGHAYTIKNSRGADVYTIGINNESGKIHCQNNDQWVGDHDPINTTMGEVLMYMSSEYPTASCTWADNTDDTATGSNDASPNMTFTPGKQDTFPDYYQNTSGGNMNLSAVFETILKERIDISFIGEQTSSMGVALNASSTVENKLNTSNFDLSNAHVTLTFEKGYSTDGKSFDFRGEILSEAQFEQATGQNVSGSISNGKLVVTGYNYAENYVSKDTSRQGYKMHIKVSNIKLKDGEYGAMELCDSNTCAIYDKGEAVNKYKAFPSFYVPKEDYVADFGLNMDVVSGKNVIGIEDNSQHASEGTALGTSADIANLGTLAKNTGFKLKTTSSTAGHGYVLTQAEGKYQWNLVNLAPASNVLFDEEGFCTQTGSGTDWTKTGTTASPNQSSGNEAFGYDPAYAGNTGSCNGSMWQTTVTSSNKTSKSIAFNFTGKGIDFIATCGPSTGIMMIKIKENGSIVKTFLVDTYNRNGTYNQVPIAQWLGGTAGHTYSVEIAAAYLTSAGALHADEYPNVAQAKAVKAPMKAYKSMAAETVEAVDAEEVETVDVSDAPAVEASVSELDALMLDFGMDPETTEIIWMDDNSILNGGTGATPTAVQPQTEAPRKKLFAVKSAAATLTAGNDGGSNAASGGLVCYFDGFRIYEPLTDDTAYPDTEKNYTYTNILGILKNEFVSGIASTMFGSTFVNSEGPTTYENNEIGGPQYEVYLKRNDAIAFIVPVGVGVQVSAKSVDGNDGRLTFNGSFTEETRSITSATEMYYSVPNSLIGSDRVLVIKNTGTGIVAVNMVKTTAADTGVEPIVNALTASNAGALRSLMAMAPTPYVAPEPDVPGAPEEPDVPDVPDVPDTPDTPDEPDTPDVPDEPDTPDTPDEPDTPDTPDEPDDDTPVIIQVVQKVVTTVKNFFGKLFGGR